MTRGLCDSPIRTPKKTCISPLPPSFFPSVFPCVRNDPFLWLMSGSGSSTLSDVNHESMVGVSTTPVHPVTPRYTVHERALHFKSTFFSKFPPKKTSYTQEKAQRCVEKWGADHAPCCFVCVLHTASFATHLWTSPWSTMTGCRLGIQWAGPL